MSGEREGGVVIVGAGAAGLSAAAALREGGVPVTVLEAAARIGGRAWTERPDALGRAPFDHGARWLHAAHRNPLVDLARRCGDPLADADTAPTRLFLDGRAATAAELAAYEAAGERLDDATAPHRAAGQPDITLAEALDPLREDPWLATVETWEGAIIAAADAAVLSVRDWHRNQLDGANLVVAGGLGAFIIRRLAGPVELSTPATRIGWDGPGGTVEVETPRGTLRCAACIVTVSTGVLAANAIRFDPALPAPVRDAIAGLPMGLATKVALPARADGCFGPRESCSLVRRARRRGEPLMAFEAWPDGEAHLVGYVGGAAAWSLAGDDRAAEAFARSELRALFGADADRDLGDGAAVTGWATDPFSRGAYAYARPGCADARGALAQPLADGRLVFAGEACRTDGLAGTVAGAWLSGRDAARAVSGAIRR